MKKSMAANPKSMKISKNLNSYIRSKAVKH